MDDSFLKRVFYTFKNPNRASEFSSNLHNLQGEVSIELELIGPPTYTINIVYHQIFIRLL